MLGAMFEFRPDFTLQTLHRFKKFREQENKVNINVNLKQNISNFEFDKNWYKS